MSKHICKFCGVGFSKESTLAAHVCEPQRRHNERNLRGVQIGFSAYRRFFEKTQSYHPLPTYEKFSSSQLYRAFVKFGYYVMRIQAVNPPKFIDYLIDNNKKIDHWCKDKIYGDYIYKYLRTEPATEALERAILYSVQWGEEMESSSEKFFEEGTESRVCYSIATGRISPWVLYNCKSGQSFLDTINEENLKIIWSLIDPDFWQEKFALYKADRDFVEDVLKQAGW